MFHTEQDLPYSFDNRCVVPGPIGTIEPSHMSNESDIAAAFHTATEATVKRELSPDYSPAPGSVDSPASEPAPATFKQPITPDQNDENREETKSVVINDLLLKPTTLTSSTPSAFGIPNLLGLSGLGQGMPDAVMTPTSPMFPSPTTVFSPVPATTTLLPRVPPLTTNAFWQQMLYNNLMLSLAANQQRLAALSQSSAVLTPSPSTPKSTSSAYSFSSVESLAQSDAVPSSSDRSPKGRFATDPTTPATGKEVRCPTCSKLFTRPWLLQNHMRVHTGEKPYACEKCGKAFADKSNLRAHTQTHSGKKPFSCLRCGKSFALKAYLSKHEESACMKGIRRRAEF